MIEALKTIGYIVISAALWMAVLVAVFDAVRRLSLGERKLGTFLFVGLTGLLCALGTFVSVWAYFHYPDRFFQSELGQDLDRGEAFYRKLPPQLGAKFSTTAAKWYFQTDGVLLNHLDKSGEWKKWQPTQDELYDRERILASDWYWSHLRNRVLDGVWVGVSWLGAAFFGWRAAKFQRRDTALRHDS